MKAIVRSTFLCQLSQNSWDTRRFTSSIHPCTWITAVFPFIITILRTFMIRPGENSIKELQQSLACHSSRLYTTASQTNPEPCWRKYFLCLLRRFWARCHLMFSRIITSSQNNNLCVTRHCSLLLIHTLSDALRAVLPFHSSVEFDLDSALFSIVRHFVYKIMRSTQDGWKVCQREETRLSKFSGMGLPDFNPSDGIGALEVAEINSGDDGSTSLVLNLLSWYISQRWFLQPRAGTKRITDKADGQSRTRWVRAELQWLDIWQQLYVRWPPIPLWSRTCMIRFFYPHIKARLELFLSLSMGD